MQAVECSKNCGNILLQANTLNTYGYYLNLADRKEEALKAMQIGRSLFARIDGDGVFYFDKYRAIINYADLLFSFGQQNEAIKQLNAFRIFIEIYGRHSDYVQNKATELQSYIENSDNNIMKFEPLKQLLEE